MLSLMIVCRRQAVCSYLCYLQLFAGIDTRALTKKIREEGTMLGKVGKKESSCYDDQL
jgi:carbamoylphosphate synthase small subunit